MTSPLSPPPYEQSTSMFSSTFISPLPMDTTPPHEQSECISDLSEIHSLDSYCIFSPNDDKQKIKSLEKEIEKLKMEKDELHTLLSKRLSVMKKKVILYQHQIANVLKTNKEL